MPITREHVAAIKEHSGELAATLDYRSDRAAWSVLAAAVSIVAQRLPLEGRAVAPALRFLAERRALLADAAGELAVVPAEHQHAAQRLRHELGVISAGELANVPPAVAAQQQAAAALARALTATSISKVVWGILRIFETLQFARKNRVRFLEWWRLLDALALLAEGYAAELDAAETQVAARWLPRLVFVEEWGGAMGNCRVSARTFQHLQPQLRPPFEAWCRGEAVDVAVEEYSFAQLTERWYTPLRAWLVLQSLLRNPTEMRRELTRDTSILTQAPGAWVDEGLAQRLERATPDQLLAAVALAVHVAMEHTPLHTPAAAIALEAVARGETGQGLARFDLAFACTGRPARWRSADDLQVRAHQVLWEALDCEPLSAAVGSIFAAYYLVDDKERVFARVKEGLGA